MEKKKELLIQILKKLIPYRNLAEGILALLGSSYVDQKAIDGLITLINHAIKSTKKQKEKNVLQKSLEMVQKIKHMEEKEQMSDEDLDKLLQDI